VASIRGWWEHLGKKRYANSTRLMITADSGGSNGYRLKLWKKELQRFADETGLEISVCHFPPGTSKWNTIEHKLFSFISINWKGRPLTSYQVIVTLITSTKTSSGLKVYAVLDDRTYPLKKEVSDQEMETLNIERNEFHGEWNYTIRPRL
jgi:Rhodopirellula transposase DDE domain